MSIPVASSTSYAGSPVGARAEAARRGLAVYFAVLVPGSGIVEWLILRKGESIGHYPWLIFLLMWMPAIASFVARAVRREGLADVSFRFGGREGGRAVILALAMPLIVGGIAYGAAWAFGLAAFTTPPALPDWLHAPRGFVPYLVVALTLGTAVGMLWAGGEEIGWRGYMLPRLVEAGVPAPLLVSGLIWAAWHLPLILSGQYASGPHPVLSAGIFVVDVIGIALVIGTLRLRSGSVWPAIVLHAAWNSIIQGPFDRSATGPGATLWVGESGLLVAAVSLTVGVVVVLLDRRRGPYP
jgi:membrane protease YdiL (CAAX protease family)